MTWPGTPTQWLMMETLLAMSSLYFYLPAERERPPGVLYVSISPAAAAATTNLPSFLPALLPCVRFAWEYEWLVTLHRHCFRIVFSLPLASVFLPDLPPAILFTFCSPLKGIGRYCNWGSSVTLFIIQTPASRQAQWTAERRTNINLPATLRNHLAAFVVVVVSSRPLPWSPRNSWFPPSNPCTVNLWETFLLPSVWRVLRLIKRR